MKGVILAGGTGSRLFPPTRVTNKHLLPVYDRPIVFYPIQTLVNTGITDILLAPEGTAPVSFCGYLVTAKILVSSTSITPIKREKAGLRMHCGSPSISPMVSRFVWSWEITSSRLTSSALASNSSSGLRGGHIILREVPNPQRFAVPVFDGERIIRIEGKPKEPESCYAVIGIYMYDTTVFDRIRRLRPSARGELEITDVNNQYVEEGTLTYSILDGWRTDAGTFESLLRANNLVAQGGANSVFPASRNRSEAVGW